MVRIAATTGITKRVHGSLPRATAIPVIANWAPKPPVTATRRATMTKRAFHAGASQATNSNTIVAIIAAVRIASKTLRVIVTSRVFRLG